MVCVSLDAEWVEQSGENIRFCVSTVFQSLWNTPSKIGVEENGAVYPAIAHI